MDTGPAEGGEAEEMQLQGANTLLDVKNQLIQDSFARHA